MKKHLPCALVGDGRMAEHFARYLFFRGNFTTMLRQSALTGPLSRGDKISVQRNIRSLENDPYQPVYRSFASTVLKGEFI